MPPFDSVAAFAVEQDAAPGARPDIAELLGPRFDQPRGKPAARTLILCAAPRAGSYELARFLTAAGLGVAHEYFNPTCAAAIAARWGLPGNPLAEPELGRYVDELRRRRAPGGAFAVKLQYWQYEDTLRNAHGRALFDGATVVHLFRADVARQFASWRRACETGRFDFTDRVTHPPRDPESVHGREGVKAMLDQLVGDDANFRRLFVAAGVRPIFCETEALMRDPRPFVARVAAALGVAVDAERLERAIAGSAPYPSDGAEARYQREAVELLGPEAFGK